LHPSTNPYQ